MHSGWIRLALRTAIVATGWTAGVLHAQEAPKGSGSLSLPTRIEPCKLIEGPPDRKGKPQVAVGCGRFGAVLGSGEDVHGQTDPTSGAIVVTLKRFGATRVYLATPRIGARPLLEEVTGDLAIALGKRPDRGIGNANVDLSQFAAKREIRVTVTDAGTSAALKGKSISMEEHVARAGVSTQRLATTQNAQESAAN